MAIVDVNSNNAPEYYCSVVKAIDHNILQRYILKSSHSVYDIPITTHTPL